MKHIFTLLFALFIHSLFAQQTLEIETDYQLRALSASEELQLRSLPVLKMSATSRSRDLPYMVDNSTQIYMRPVFNQAGYSCGQASGVAYNFTYEMARKRDVPANTTNNQYTTHFTWNWWNGGNGWYGVSYLHSFQVLKYIGEPDVTTYGGLSSGGEKRWMSGYDNYYTAMTNRITEAYQIPCGTAEELLTLKHWLNDHMDGTVGGVASYYAQFHQVTNQLPSGTPEAGKYVLTSYGGSANHAMCIVGYNDSIRWDYNSDGQYTNDVDINSDGEVNMKDWEIGGFKMVQSYGGVPNWGDQGYAYMMYKTIADDLGAGGIWNHCVHVLDVKENYEPKLTAQLTLTHNRRKQIKILAGLSNNTNSSFPEYTLDFPIFDYQGGNNFMQGGNTPAEKTIEIGLDLSALLTEVSLDQNVKLFLMVVENDTDNSGSGSIDSFSIWDYTNSPVNTACSQTNVPLVNNDTTILSVTYNFNFDRVHIEDETLPPAPEGIPYTHQMSASGGAAPYVWEFDKTYETLSASQSYPAIAAGQPLYPSNNDNGKVNQLIDFEFPYYDSIYSNICVHVDGYLMFDEQLYPYPYFNDDKVLFEVTRNISPFNTQFQHILAANSDGLWYYGDSTHATFWWKTTHESDNNTSFNYTVTLYPSGEIKYNYDNMNGLAYLDWWIAGISDGDTKNYEILDISHDQILPIHRRYNFMPYDYPIEFEISEEGVLSGIPQQAYAASEISFKVTDNNFISSSKTLLLSSSGIIVQNSVESGNDDLIEYGETSLISIVVTSVEDDPIENVSMEIAIQDEYITLTNSSEYIGTLLPGIAVNKPEAFIFSVSTEIPDKHIITFNTNLITPDTTYQGSFIYTGFAPIAIVANVLVDDENNRLDPGDTANIVLSIQNTGGADLDNVLALLSSDDPNITINIDEGTIPKLEPEETGEITYNITVAEEAENGHLAAFHIDIFGDKDYETEDAFDLVIGFNAEDFETGDLHFINWGFDGDKDWQIDLNTRYEGSFSSRSGYISHAQESVMILDMEVITEGEISFYKKVSCEDDENNNNYDYLLFSIDGIEQQRWDGDQDWTLETFSVESGFHRLAWVYHKDSTISSRMDGAWIDYITFPSGNDAPPFCTYNPESFEVTMKPDNIYSDTLWITNTGQGNLQMELYVKGETPENSGERSIFGSYLSCSRDILRIGYEYPITLTLYNAGADNEWIRDLYIDFPIGMELTTAGNFVGGSGGDMLHDGTFGDGITAHWHGEDSVGWGVVKGGQTAISEIMVYIHDELVENASLNFEIHGENYGLPPHIIIGSMPIRNLGPEISWFSIDTNSAEIQGGETLPFVVTYNTDGLEDGNYKAEILSINNFQQEVIIPVNLSVDHLVGMADGIHKNSLMLTVYPNPVNGAAFISYTLASDERISLEIFNLQGKLVRSLLKEQTQKQGRQVINWDTTSDSGAHLPTGVYFCKLTAGTTIEIIKIVLAE